VTTVSAAVGGRSAIRDARAIDGLTGAWATARRVRKRRRALGAIGDARAITGLTTALKERTTTSGTRRRGRQAITTAGGRARCAPQGCGERRAE
jgi:hypothetical protein